MGFGLRLRLGQAHLAILAEGCCEICCSHRMKSLPELSWLEGFRGLYSHDRCFPQGGWQPDVYVRFQVAEGLAFMFHVAPTCHEQSGGVCGTKLRPTAHPTHSGSLPLQL